MGDEGHPDLGWHRVRVVGRHHRGPELPHRSGEGEDDAREDTPARERERHPAECLDGALAQAPGRLFDLRVDPLEAGAGRDDDERRGDERLREDDAEVAIRQPDAQGLGETAQRAQLAEPAQEHHAADDRWHHQRQDDEGVDEKLSRERGPCEDVGQRHAEDGREERRDGRGQDRVLDRRQHVRVREGREFEPVGPREKRDERVDEVRQQDGTQEGEHAPLPEERRVEAVLAPRGPTDPICDAHGSTPSGTGPCARGNASVATSPFSRSRSGSVARNRTNCRPAAAFSASAGTVAL